MRAIMKIFAWIMAGIVGVLVLAVAAAVIAFWAPDRPVSELRGRWAPPPSTFVDIAGMNVHMRDEGPRDDPLPIVLLHGTSVSLHTWQGWVGQLKDRRRVIRFDLPGFGLTGPSPSGDYSISAYTRFVRAALDKLGVARCVVAGNSLGGEIAWASALALPDRIEKLILVDAAGYPSHSTSVPIGFRIARTPGLNRLARNLLPRRLVEASVRNVYGDPSKVTPELVDRYYELTLREGNRRAVVERFKQMPRGEMAERIREIKLPTLILWGGRDRLIPPTDAERFHRDIAGSRLVMFNDLGHVPHEEDPVRTAAAVKKFLDVK